MSIAMTSKTTRWHTPPPRFVARCVETGLYLRYDCLDFTASRVWAWTGRAHQIDCMLDTFGLRGSVRIEEDSDG